MLTWNSVEGSSYTVENSTNQTSWTTHNTGLAAATNATTTAQSIATIGSSGREYGRVTRTALATYDVPTTATAVTTSQTATGTYNVVANTAPTVTTISALTGAVRNTAFSISYATLAAADEADANGDAISFRIEAVGTGTLTKSSAAVTAGSTLISSGDTVVWTPATGYTGTTAASSVKAYDGTLLSTTAVAVNITVALTAADLQLASWFTSRTGRYARIVETDAALLSDTTETTWTRTSGPNTLAQTSPVYAGPQQLDYSASWVYLRTPSLGTYTMGPWYNDATRSNSALFLNICKNQGLIVKIPRTSTLAAAPATKTQTADYMLGGVIQGGVGYYVDGVALFDSTDGFSYASGSETSRGTGQWHRDAWQNEQHTFDKSYAHQQNTGFYHNHANPIALRYQLGDAVTFNSSTKVYSETMTPTAHSPIIGWMLDGLPVYGPYGYSTATDASSGVRRMVSGYVLRDGTTTGVDNLTTAGRTVPAWALRNGATSVAGPVVSTTYPLGRYVEDNA